MINGIGHACVYLCLSYEDANIFYDFVREFIESLFCFRQINIEKNYILENF